MSETKEKLEIRPITLKDANEFVAKYHRHHKPTVGHKFSISCVLGGTVRGLRSVVDLYQGILTMV
jgi:hypothetical protein